MVHNPAETLQYDRPRPWSPTNFLCFVKIKLVLRPQASYLSSHVTRVAVQPFHPTFQGAVTNFLESWETNALRRC